MKKIIVTLLTYLGVGIAIYVFTGMAYIHIALILFSFFLGGLVERRKAKKSIHPSL